MRWDNEVEDWQGYLPGRATYSEYTRPILEVAEHTPTDINVYYRDQFNEWAVNTGGSINVAGMRRFYSDPLGMFARFRAFELGPENCFSRVIKMGKKRHAQQEYHWLYNEVYNRIGRNVPLCVLDHGCGHGRDGIAFMRNGWHVAFVDYKLPSLEMLLDMARRNYDSHADETDFLGLFEPSDAPAYAGRYHVVVSQDVLEHCLDPITELHHKDGDRLNDRIENLQPLRPSKHRLAHQNTDTKLICLRCKKIFVVKAWRIRSRPTKFCSQKCFHKYPRTVEHKEKIRKGLLRHHKS